MRRKLVIFVADSLDNAHKFQQVLAHLDVEVAAGSSAHLERLLVQHPSYDLVVYEARGDAFSNMGRVEAAIAGEGGGAALLRSSNGRALTSFASPFG